MAAREAEIITDKDQMRRWSRSMRAQGKTIGLVPTMGYLHQGHISLITEAKKHSNLIVVSIYVNPGQFSPSEDLSTYPSDFEGDLQKLRTIPGGVDVVFHPHDLYDYGNLGLASGSNKRNCNSEAVVSCLEQRGFGGHETWVRVENLEKGLCGKSRPVFFRGVATIVTKLFNIVEPDVAVFGKKDYQQWRIIQQMVRDLDFSIKAIGSDIVREHDGLAMSSRNVYLSPEQRQKACIFKAPASDDTVRTLSGFLAKALSMNISLSRAKSAAENGQVNCRELRDSVIHMIQDTGGKIDYAEIVDQESLEAVEEIKRPVVFCIAAWFGKVRLIDNMEIDAP